MLHKMIGLASVLVAMSGVPALACPCNQPQTVYGAEQQLVVPQAPQPRYYVNQGPTLTGPDTYAPEPVYQEHGVTGYYPYVSSYPRPYSGGPYADPNNHYSYGSTSSQGPVVYRYHYSRGYRAARRYDVPRYAPYGAGPRFHRSHFYRGTPRYGVVAPRYRAARRYGYAPRFDRGPRYGVAPRFHSQRFSAAPGYRPHAGHDRPRSQRPNGPAPRYMN